MAQFAILGTRAARAPLDAYGEQGAEYIEHFERLRVWQVVQQGQGGPLDRLAAADGAYPPGLHIATLPLAAIFGQRAEDLWMAGWPWWLLLAGACAVIGRRLGGSAPACATAILLVPALGGAAARYYYDLPMAALAWTAVAVLVTGWPGSIARAAAAGFGAGLLGGSAAVVKWTALPFLAPMFLGALGVGGLSPTLRPRLVAALALAAGIALPTAGFLVRSDRSWQEMSFTFAAEETPLAERLQRAARSVIEARPPPQDDPEGTLPTTAPGRAAWYAGGLATRLLSPPLAALALGLLVPWWRSRRGRFLVGATVLGQVTILSVLVPPLDERFLLTLAPAVALAAGIGWSGLPRGRLPVALVAVGLGLLVSGDFHLDEEPGVPSWGLRGSWEQRGWGRFDQRRPARSGLREALWAAVGPSQPDAVGVLGDGVVDHSGDEEWWEYRALLAEVQGTRPPARPLRTVRLCRQTVPVQAVVAPDVRLGLDPEPWCPAGGDFDRPVRVRDPGGGLGALVWLPAGPR